MGRIERRRQEKNNKNKKITKENNIEEYNGKNTLYTAIKIMAVMVLLIFILYYVVAVFVTKEISISTKKDEETTDTTTNTVSDRILARNIFNQKEETYYVYFYDFTDADQNIAMAINNLSDSKVYKVDTSSSLNKNYVTEESGNKQATSVDELKVKSPTLIKITNDKIVEYYEDIDPILAYLEK